MSGRNYGGDGRDNNKTHHNNYDAARRAESDYNSELSRHFQFYDLLIRLDKSKGYQYSSKSCPADAKEKYKQSTSSKTH